MEPVLCCEKRHFQIVAELELVFGETEELSVFGEGVDAENDGDKG